MSPLQVLKAQKRRHNFQLLYTFFYLVHTTEIKYLKT